MTGLGTIDRMKTKETKNLPDDSPMQLEDYSELDYGSIGFYQQTPYLQIMIKHWGTACLNAYCVKDANMARFARHQRSTNIVIHLMTYHEN